MFKITIRSKTVICIMLAISLMVVSSCGKSDTMNDDSETNSSVSESSESEKITIPEKYSLIDENKVTEFKNQHQSGLCWAYAAIASAESSLIVSGLEDTSVDLSEGHVCYSVYPFEEDRPDGSMEDGIYITGDKSANETIPYYIGGSSFVAAGCFANGAGPIYEKDAPLETDAGDLKKSVEKIIQLEEEDKLSKYSSEYLLTKMNIYENDEDIKKAILTNGAVSTAIFVDTKGASQDKDGNVNYYLISRDKKDTQTNHVITIVGWDDNYSKDNFTNKPEHDGAWLIKDSLGNNNIPDYNGCWWMSYDEYQNGCMGMEFCKRSDYGQLLFYDAIGPFDYIKAEGDDTTVANVFTADGSNEIKGVCIATKQQNQKVKISIYMNPEKDKPDSGENVLVMEQVIEYPGYEVVKLDQTLQVASGDSFSIVVDYTNADNTDEIVPVEGDADNLPKSSLGEAYLVSGEGESYAKSGDTWYDLSKPESSAAFGKSGKINNVSIKVLMAD